MNPENTARPADRLIVALDVDSVEKSNSIVAELDGMVTMFKVGLQLYTLAGPRFVEKLAASGKKIFLDLKFHDIPNTVAKAGIEAARLGVWMFNVHASGGSEMMQRTRDEVSDFCIKTDVARPLITAVTVLTSSGPAVLSEIGVSANVEGQVEKLAQLASESGMDGVVASAKEIGAIRRSVAAPSFLIVTPGIRPENATYDDQKRVTTPGTAISKGADHLVVGRPITAASNPRDAAENILNEIAKAL